MCRLAGNSLALLPEESNAAFLGVGLNPGEIY
jgi:hypothetical protein